MGWGAHCREDSGPGPSRGAGGGTYHSCCEGARMRSLSLLWILLLRSRALGRLGSVFAAHGLWSTDLVVMTPGLSCLRFPKSGIEPVSPASASGVFTPETPGKSQNFYRSSEVETFVLNVLY